MKQITDNKKQAMISDNCSLLSDRGFTLIEAVVSTAIFAFIITSIIGVYIATLQLDQKSRAQRALAQNARFIMEFLSKEIKNGSIAYSSCASSCILSGNDLYIKNQANASEHFFLNGNDLVLIKNSQTANINSSSVKVSNLKFYTRPSLDPFYFPNNSNEQPHVTVVMVLTSNLGNKPTAVATMSLQSTFAVRSYPSRH